MTDKAGKMNRLQAQEMRSGVKSSRAGQDNGKDRVSTGAQAATGGTQGNQLAHGAEELRAQHPRSGSRVMRGAR